MLAFKVNKGLYSHGPAQGHHSRLEHLLAAYPRGSAFFEEYGESNQNIYTAPYSP
jgi:hypothetical protein